MFGIPAATPEQYGWLLVLCWLIYQIYGPKFGIETRLYGLLLEFKEALDDLRGRIANIETRQENHIQVTRAQSRIHPEMDEEEVDEYLVENGIDPNDFINETDMRGEETRSDED